MEEWKRHCQLINYIIAEHHKQQAKTLLVKFVDGHDIMNTFGLAPGPLIGKLLARVHEAHASGELSTKQEALALVGKELSATRNQQAGVCQNSQNSRKNNAEHKGRLS
jgi:hypothetical protein